MSVLSVIDGTNIVIILEDMLLSAQVRMKICYWNNYHSILISIQKRGESWLLLILQMFLGQPQATDACQWTRNPDGRYICAVEGCEDKDKR